MSKIQFVRGLWGNDQKTKDYVKGSDEIDSKILPKIYVYGDDNYKFLKGLGKDCELISNSPNVHKDNARHKLEIIEKALQEFTEIIFVDWHIKLKGDIPFNFEGVRKNGAPLRSALRMYKKRQAMWRKDDQRKVPASDFIYLKGQRVIKDLIETYESMEAPFSLDQILMKYIDHMTGKWRGVDYYNQFFEIPFFSMSWEKELYGEVKKEVSFVSLKDIKEEKAREKRGVKKGKVKKIRHEKHENTPVPTVVEQENPFIVPQKPLIAPERLPIAPEKPVVVPQVQQVQQVQQVPQVPQENKTYRSYPISGECWTSTFSKRK